MCFYCAGFDLIEALTQDDNLGRFSSVSGFVSVFVLCVSVRGANC